MTNLIITDSNYQAVNNQVYSSGGNYACNYPVYQGWTGNTIDSVAGDYFITASGGLLDLIAGGFENGNMPAYRYIVCRTGEIFELDYIISDTSAKLKQPAAYGNSGMDAFVVDYRAQPVVRETLLMDIGSGGFGLAAVQVNLVSGFSQIDVSPNYDTTMGSEPFLVDIITPGGNQLGVNIIFESYNT